MSLTNKKWILKTRPKGLVEESNFELIEEAVPELNDGKISRAEFFEFIEDFKSSLDLFLLLRLSQSLCLN